MKKNIFICALMGAFLCLFSFETNSQGPKDNKTPTQNKKTTPQKTLFEQTRDQARLLYKKYPATVSVAGGLAACATGYALLKSNLVRESLAALGIIKVEPKTNKLDPQPSSIQDTPPAATSKEASASAPQSNNPQQIQKAIGVIQPFQGPQNDLEQALLYSAGLVGFGLISAKSSLARKTFKAISESFKPFVTGAKNSDPIPFKDLAEKTVKNTVLGGAALGGAYYGYTKYPKELDEETKASQEHILKTMLALAGCTGIGFAASNQALRARIHFGLENRLNQHIAKMMANALSNANKSTLKTIGTPGASINPFPKTLMSALKKGYNNSLLKTVTDLPTAAWTNIKAMVPTKPAINLRAPSLNPLPALKGYLNPLLNSPATAWKRMAKAKSVIGFKVSGLNPLPRLKKKRDSLNISETVTKYKRPAQALVLSGACASASMMYPWDEDIAISHEHVLKTMLASAGCVGTAFVASGILAHTRKKWSTLTKHFQPNVYKPGWNTPAWLKHKNLTPDAQALQLKESEAATNASDLLKSIQPDQTTSIASELKKAVIYHSQVGKLSAQNRVSAINPLPALKNAANKATETAQRVSLDPLTNALKNHVVKNMAESFANAPAVRIQPSIKESIKQELLDLEKAGQSLKSNNISATANAPAWLKHKNLTPDAQALQLKESEAATNASDLLKSIQPDQTTSIASDLTDKFKNNIAATFNLSNLKGACKTSIKPYGDMLNKLAQDYKEAAIYHFQVAELSAQDGLSAINPLPALKNAANKAAETAQHISLDSLTNALKNHVVKNMAESFANAPAVRIQPSIKASIKQELLDLEKAGQSLKSNNISAADNAANLLESIEPNPIKSLESYKQDMRTKAYKAMERKFEKDYKKAQRFGSHHNPHAYKPGWNAPAWLKHKNLTPDAQALQLKESEAATNTSDLLKSIQPDQTTSIASGLTDKFKNNIAATFNTTKQNLSNLKGAGKTSIKAYADILNKLAQDYKEAVIYHSQVGKLSAQGGLSAINPLPALKNAANRAAETAQRISLDHLTNALKNHVVKNMAESFANAPAVRIQPSIKASIKQELLDLEKAGQSLKSNNISATANAPAWLKHKNLTPDAQALQLKESEAATNASDLLKSIQPDQTTSIASDLTDKFKNNIAATFNTTKQNLSNLKGACKTSIKPYGDMLNKLAQDYKEAAIYHSQVAELSAQDWLSAINPLPALKNAANRAAENAQHISLDSLANALKNHVVKNMAESFANAPAVRTQPSVKVSIKQELLDLEKAGQSLKSNNISAADNAGNLLESIEPNPIKSLGTKPL